ncbi:MAG: hypothetical protein ACRDJC_12900 [Thermomicrobiales bacterium]
MVSMAGAGRDTRWNRRRTSPPDALLLDPMPARLEAAGKPEVSRWTESVSIT